MSSTVNPHIPIEKQYNFEDVYTGRELRGVQSGEKASDMPELFIAKSQHLTKEAQYTKYHNQMKLLRRSRGNLIKNELNNSSEMLKYSNEITSKMLETLEMLWKKHHLPTKDYRKFKEGLIEGIKSKDSELDLSKPMPEPGNEHINDKIKCICDKDWRNPFTNKFECICGATSSYRPLNMVQNPHTSELLGRYGKIINHPKKLPNHPRNKYGYFGERYTTEEIEKIQEQICYGPKVTPQQKRE